mmetsp:Transcript_24832/g.57560  ORF Transcript_24832/g.57560 Transcript_24832/m.57560 type:complete len:254 (-) Transcript_24832:484-1245(-)
MLLCHVVGEKERGVCRVVEAGHVQGGVTAGVCRQGVPLALQQHRAHVLAPLVRAPVHGAPPRGVGEADEGDRGLRVLVLFADQLPHCLGVARLDRLPEPVRAGELLLLLPSRHLRLPPLPPLVSRALRVRQGSLFKVCALHVKLLKQLTPDVGRRRAVRRAVHSLEHGLHDPPVGRRGRSATEPQAEPCTNPHLVQGPVLCNQPVLDDRVPVDHRTDRLLLKDGLVRLPAPRGVVCGQGHAHYVKVHRDWRAV